MRLGALVVAFVLIGAADARADPGEDDAPAPPPDTGVPGPWVRYVERPTLAGEIRTCSMRVPLCVHSGRGVPGRAALDVLAASERAWATLTGAMGLPAPDVDPSELHYPVFLVDRVDDDGERGATHVAARDVRSRLDRARAFTVIDAGVRAGCGLDALAAREIARASIHRASPAMPEGIARAQTSYLAQLVAPCSVAFAAESAAAFQSRPDRSVVDGHVSEIGASAQIDLPSRPADARFSEGAGFWWGRIDWAYSVRPGGLLMATWALSPSLTDVGAQRWHDEPDVFDVLRVSFKDALHTGSTLDDLLLDTAIARAFMGSGSAHQPETRTLGDAARVPLDWDLPWPSAPRRVAPRAPVHPTGASYLVVRRDGAPRDARLRVEIAWEEHALFRWAFVKLDAQGRELGRVVIPTRERAVEAQMTLADLGAADRIMLVGVNAGDPAYRFDPDDEVWEPHGWLLTLAAE
ncbi:MAG: hypothetical protein KF819_19805 [Labilithrix sp.]|nr:hypothetical protein [Labilithrix sp.]